MNPDLAIVIALLAAAILMFILNRPRMDAVALIMMTALPLTGVISVNEALMGFSDPSIVLIGLLFVIGEGLVRTGIAQRIGDWLVSHAGRSETRLLILLMPIVAFVGSVMSSTAVVAIFVPVVLRIVRSARIPAGRLMMPLSVAGLISGMMTLVGTPPNLVINGELVRNGFEGFHFFAFTPFGVPVLALAVVYMLVARRWLTRPDRKGEVQRRPVRMSEWVEAYGLAGRAHRFRVGPGSPLVGRMLEDLDLRGSAGINIIAIERRGRFSRNLIHPTAKTELRADDILLMVLLAPTIDAEEFRRRFGLEKLPLSGSHLADRSQEIGMAEAVIPATSELVGATVVEARFRSEYGLTAIGLRRGSGALAESLLHEPLKAGDTLLLVGPWKAIRRLQSGRRDLVILDLPAELDDVAPAASRAPHAVFSIAVMVGLMVTGVVPNVQAALIGCLLLGVLGCIDLDAAYRSVHWQSMVLIIGMLPFSFALQKTGGVEMGVAALLGLVEDASPRIILAGVFLLTAISGLFISNTATAVLMAPVALAIANELGASPYPFAMTVALAASSAFMTPVSSPVNTLVVGPGNYTFADFVRVGVPLTFITMIVSIALVPWLLPF